jgi:hypothetical protein
LTRIATASSPDSSRSNLGGTRRRRPSWGARCAALLLLSLPFASWTQACKSGGGSNATDGGSNVPCPPQAASSSGSAAELTDSKSVENKLCYEGTSNWYYISVPAGSTLLDVKAGYPSAADTSVQLDIKVYYKTNATTLTQLANLVASSGGTDAGGSTEIETTVHAVQPGDYYIQASDAHNVNFDMTNAYSIEVDYAADPDTHEPNDTIADAKPSDSKPGWLAYLGDLDIFKATATAGDLLTLTISNPLTAKATINYAITDASGTMLYSNVAPPASKALSTSLSVPAAGTYYVTLSYPMGAIPSHDPSSEYTLSFGSRSNPDTTDNHTAATAVCPGGGTGPCSMAFSGSDIKLPKVSSYITVPGQSDFYRVDVASGAALVLGVNLTSAASTPVKYAVDLLTEDPGSSCSVDSDCVAMNAKCNYSIDMMGVAVTTDCELSHACLPPDNYKFCSGGSKCSLCQGAGICSPDKVCLVPQFLSDFSPSGMKIGGPTVNTAQPLFTNGTYYVSVHDDSYSNVDLDNPYTLALELAPELDANDQSPNPNSRNNFYEPYPNNMLDQAPNQALAVDITSDLTSGTPVTGWISYATDNDWYKFQHPCPGMNCALDFEWIQPGPSNVQVAFFMINEDLTQHEAFAYDGDPKKLTMPMPGSFDNQDCYHCSFASATEGDGGPYTYYLRVAAVDQSTYDYTTGGQYSVTVTKGDPGCPTACSHATSPATCRCWCPAPVNACPAPKF